MKIKTSIENSLFWKLIAAVSLVGVLMLIIQVEGIKKTLTEPPTTVASYWPSGLEERCYANKTITWPEFNDPPRECIDHACYTDDMKQCAYYFLYDENVREINYYLPDIFPHAKNYVDELYRKCSDKVWCMEACVKYAGQPIVTIHNKIVCSEYIYVRPTGK